MNGTYQEVRFWSPTLGCQAARVSMADGRGGEHYCIIPFEQGRPWREARAEALERVMEHIRWGKEPGEVKLAIREQIAGDLPSSRDNSLLRRE